jgi:hypothetical protein
MPASWTSATTPTILSAEMIRRQQVGPQRQPDVNGLIGDKRPRNDADHFAGFAVDVNRFAEDRGTIAKSRTKKPLADDHHTSGVGQIILHHKVSTEAHRGAEQPEVIGRDARRLDRLRGFGIRERHRRNGGVVGGKVLEDPGVVAEDAILRQRDAMLVTDERLADELHQPLRLGIRQRLEQDLVDDRKDRRVHRNAQRKRKRGRQREARVAAQHSKGVQDFAEQVRFPPALRQAIPVASRRRVYSITGKRGDLRIRTAGSGSEQRKLVA